MIAWRAWCLTAFALSATGQALPSTVQGEVPPALLEELARVQDLTLGYDHLAFWAVLQFVQDHPAAREPGTAIDLTDWQALIDRPHDHRGRRVRVRAAVVRCTAWRPNRPELAHVATVRELHLRQADQPCLAKLLIVPDCGEIPVGTEVEAEGLFVQLQTFHTRGGVERVAAILVGGAPIILRPGGALVPTASPASALWLWLSLGAGTLIAWRIVVRRARRRARVAWHSLESDAPPGANLSADLHTWAITESSLAPSRSEKQS